MKLITSIAEGIRAVRRSAYAFERSTWSTAARYLWLLGPQRFSHAEITTLALLDPRLGWSRLRQYQSKESVWPVYEAMNRRDDLLLLDDKARFHDECVRRGLPTIPVCLRISGDELRRMADAADPRRDRSVAALLARLPREFVVKPSFGLQGQGVQFFAHDGRAVAAADGQALAPGRFLDQLAAQLRTPTMSTRYQADRHVLVFQPTVRAHPALRTLSGGDALQCARICTLLDARRGGVVHFAFLKLTAGDNRIDNFHKGRSGNLVAYIDEATGEVVAAIGPDPRCGLMRFVDVHPTTARPLIGFAIPHWREACDLAVRAANAFAGTGAIGWDIAFTPEGPVLLEGNGTWDPLAPMYRKIHRARGRAFRGG